MTRKIFLKIFFLYLLAYCLASSDAFAKTDNDSQLKLPISTQLKFEKKSLASSWAHQQIETNRAQELAGDHSPLIAIIDTGLDLAHPDLKNSLWQNPGETGMDSSGKDKAHNGIDDDGNGYIDDAHGWNFVTGSPDLTDRHGHGTHIAGIISSIAPQSRLMVIKYYDAKSSPEENVLHTLQAFKYAIQMQAQIINFSGGGPGANKLEESILKVAEAQSILLVAAAGNDGLNTDHQPYYPADYSLSNILSVTALNSIGQLPTYANFGSQSVRIAAPGDKIRSTLPGGRYGEMSGTSQATAFVTGAAALLLSRTHLKPGQVIEKLISCGVREASLVSKTIQSTRLDAFRSLTMKGPGEAAEGFQFENNDSWENDSYTVNHSFNSSIDESASTGNGLAALTKGATILERNHF